MESMDTEPFVHSDLSYGPHSLQTIRVWTRKPGQQEATIPGPPAATPSSAPASKKFWVIYIHGGAWRDPRISSSSFTPTIQYLLTTHHTTIPPAHPSATTAITAFASLNYRLSPHPSSPQDRATTPTTDYRNARHPDHVNDVVAALRMLQRSYRFGHNYILIGHSCGATLALQVIMGLGDNPPPHEASGSGGDCDCSRDSGEGEAGDTGKPLALPAAVVGIEGIYNFRSLVSRFGPGYDPIFRVPFGADGKEWDLASPARFGGWDRHNKDSEKHITIALAWSEEDELVDGEEIEEMGDVLEKAGVECRRYTDLKGSHDGVWERGEEVARLCKETLQLLAAPRASFS